MPVPTSASVRWWTISPADQSCSLGRQSACAWLSPSISLSTWAREDSEIVPQRFDRSGQRHHVPPWDMIRPDYERGQLRYVSVADSASSRTPGRRDLHAARLRERLDQGARGRGRAARRPDHDLRRGGRGECVGILPFSTPTPCSWSASTATSRGASTGRSRRAASTRARARARPPSASWPKKRDARRAPGQALRLPHVQEHPARDRAPLPGPRPPPGLAPARRDGVHRAARVPLRRGGAHGRARRDQGLDDRHRRPARGAPPRRLAGGHADAATRSTPGLALHIPATRKSSRVGRA